MKKYTFKLWLIGVFLFISGNLYSQGFKSVYVAGGVNYIPARGFFADHVNSSWRNVDKTSFSGSVGVIYDYSN